MRNKVGREIASERERAKERGERLIERIT